MRHRPLVIRANLDIEMVRWGLAMLRNCTGRPLRSQQGPHDAAGRIQPRLPEGAACQAPALPTTSARAARCSSFRTRKQFDASAADIAVLQRSGVGFRLLDVAGCIEREPALATVREKFVGGPPAAGRRDRRLLQVHATARRPAGQGRRDLSPVGPHREPGRSGARIDGVQTDAGRLVADAYLVALGSYSPLLLRTARHPHSRCIRSRAIRSPCRSSIRPGAPESTVMDETHKVAVTRLGDAIRVGGTAELAGYTLKLHEARRHTLEHVVGDLFPHGGDLSKAEFWCGLRPMTPDGTPLVGPTDIGNLYWRPATAHSAGPWRPAPRG
jgi:D-amino-acid dehydrogenase